MLPTDKPLGKKHIGVAGTLVMISQFWFSQQGTRDIKHEIDILKEDYHQSQINTEKYFVRKTELGKVASKLDRMSTELARLTEQIKSIRMEATLFSGRREYELTGLLLLPPTKFKGGKI